MQNFQENYIFKHSKTDLLINSKCISGNRKIEDVINHNHTEPVRRAEIKLVALFSSLNIAFHAIDKLCEALPVIFPNCNIAKKVFLHRTKTTKILQNILAPHFFI